MFTRGWQWHCRPIAVDLQTSWSNEVAAFAALVSSLGATRTEKFGGASNTRKEYDKAGDVHDVLSLDSGGMRNAAAVYFSYLSIS